MALLPIRLTCVPAGMRVLALPLILGFGGCNHQQQTAPAAAQADSAPTAPVAVATESKLANTFTAAGEFLPYQQVELHAEVAGYLKSIRVDIGDHVKKGEVLATLDIPELDAQVLGAKAGVRQTNQRIAQAKSGVERAKADYVVDHLTAQRLRKASAAQPGLIAQQELDDADAKEQAAAAQVEASKSALAAAQEGLQVANATSQQYTSMANYSHITAPFNGVVTWRYADTGALIQAGTSNSNSMPVVKIAQVDVLRLRVPIPESLVAHIKDGDTATIRVDALHRTIQGKVTRATGALDESTRTEQVEIDVKNPDGSIQPGMFGTVDFAIRNAEGLTVPITAVETGTGQPYVLQVDANGIVHQQNITEGLVTASLIEVSSGLKPGDKVITANLGNYSNGEHVVPKLSAIAQAIAEEK